MKINIKNTLKLISSSSLILSFSFLLRFISTFLLAKFLQPDQLGIYSWTISVFGIATILTNFGLDLFLIKKIPSYKMTAGKMVGAVIKYSKKQVNLNTTLLLLITFPIILLSKYFYQSSFTYYLELLIVLFGLPFAAYSLIYSTTLRSFNFPLTGQIIDSILQTGIFVLLISITFYKVNIAITNNIGSLLIIFLFVCSWVLAFFISKKLTEKNVIILDHEKPDKSKVKKWRKTQFSITVGVLGWSLLGRSDILILGFLVAPSDLAGYFICLRVAETLLFFSNVSYFIWSAEISRSISNGNLIETQMILKRSSVLCSFSSFILMCLGIFFSEQILVLINEVYLIHTTLLKYALILFFVIGSSGMINPLFYILGEQDYLAKIQWVVGLLFLILILLIVPYHGIEGCLILFGACKILYISVLAIKLKKKHKLSILPW